MSSPYRKFVLVSIISIAAFVFFTASLSYAASAEKISVDAAKTTIAYSADAMGVVPQDEEQQPALIDPAEEPVEDPVEERAGKEPEPVEDDEKIEVEGVPPMTPVNFRSGGNSNNFLDGNPIDDDEVFVRNTSSQTLNNAYVAIAISFPPEGDPLAVQKSDLSKIRLQDGSGRNIPTQIEPTSMYKGGNENDSYVLTAIAHAIILQIGPGQKQVYKIVRVTTTQAPFQFHSDVQSFLNQGSLNITSRDIKGKDYRVAVPIGQLSSMDVIADGPVVKILGYHDAHEPLVPSQSDLTHLFASQVYLTFVSGQPFVRYQHLLVNSDDISKTYNHQTGNYSRFQNGDVVFDSAFATINTVSPSSFYLIDEDYIKPTKVSQSGNTILVEVFPQDGQVTLGNDYPDYCYPTNNCTLDLGTYSCTQNTGYTGSCSLIIKGGYRKPNHGFVHNYLGSAQAVLTEGMIYFGSMRLLDYDVIGESVLESGQSLSRWNRTGHSLYGSIPNPENLGTAVHWDFEQDASEKLADMRSTQAAEPFRFTSRLMGRKRMAQTGDGPLAMDMIQEADVKHKMSCQDECKTDYIRSLKAWNFAVPSTKEFIIGYKPAEHIGAYPWSYGSFGYASRQFCEVGSDYLGFKVTRAGHGDCRVEPGAHQDHRFNYPTDPSRGWTAYDDAHFGWQNAYARLTGDPAARLILYSVISPWVNTYNHPGHTRFGGLSGQIRGFGRFMSAAKRAVEDFSEPFFLQTLEKTIDFIEGWQVKQPSESGTHPVTGEGFPYGFIPGDFIRGSKPDVRMHQYWEQSLCMTAIAHAYADVLEGPIKQKAENILRYFSEYVTKFAFKYPSETRNGKEINPGKGPIDEGMGGLPYDLVTQPSGSLENVRSHTSYGYTIPQWTVPAICWLSKYYPASTELKEMAKWAFENYRLYYTGTHNVSYRWAKRVLNMNNFKGGDICGLTHLMEIPTAYEPSQTICEDNDGDGWSTCIGDCNDTDADINPSKIEDCYNGIDDNCNGPVDCDDAMCGDGEFSGVKLYCAGRSNGFCGDGVINPNNSNGRQEHSDYAVGHGGTNLCSDGKLTPAYAYSKTPSNPSGTNCFCTSEMSQCQNTQVQSCPLQLGVCQGAMETCQNNVWPGCSAQTYANHNSHYQEQESDCTDQLDNDCDGLTDCDDPQCQSQQACRINPPILHYFDPSFIINDRETIVILKGENLGRVLAIAVRGGHITLPLPNELFKIKDSETIEIRVPKGAAVGTYEVKVFTRDLLFSNSLEIRVRGSARGIAPTIDRVVPPIISNDKETIIRLEGEGFSEIFGIFAVGHTAPILYPSELVDRVSSERIDLKVPKGVAAGRYFLMMVNDTLEQSNAIEVVVEEGGGTPHVVQKPEN